MWVIIQHLLIEPWPFNGLLDTYWSVNSLKFLRLKLFLDFTCQKTAAKILSRKISSSEQMQGKGRCLTTKILSAKICFWAEFGKTGTSKILGYFDPMIIVWPFSEFQYSQLDFVLLDWNMIVYIKSIHPHRQFNIKTHSSMQHKVSFLLFKLVPLHHPHRHFNIKTHSSMQHRISFLLFKTSTPIYKQYYPHTHIATQSHIPVIH